MNRVAAGGFDRAVLADPGISDTAAASTIVRSSQSFRDAREDNGRGQFNRCVHDVSISCGTLGPGAEDRSLCGTTMPDSCLPGGLGLAGASQAPSNTLAFQTAALLAGRVGGPVIGLVNAQAPAAGAISPCKRHLLTGCAQESGSPIQSQLRVKKQ